jgi:hypothetical protein
VTALGNCEDKTVAVSESWGAKSMDARALKVTSPEAYASDAFKAGTRAASGLIAFHAWLGTGDHKDDHLVVRPGTQPDTYEVAGVDFADAFSFDSTGGNVTVPAGPPALVTPDYRDVAVMQEAIRRIEDMSDDDIRSVVESLPADVLTPADKQRITQGLIARKTKIAPAFRAAGWLTPPNGV